MVAADGVKVAAWSRRMGSSGRGKVAAWSRHALLEGVLFQKTDEFLNILRSRQGRGGWGQGRGGGGKVAAWSRRMGSRSRHGRGGWGQDRMILHDSADLCGFGAILQDSDDLCGFVMDLH